MSCEAKLIVLCEVEHSAVFYLFRAVPELALGLL